MKLNIYTTSHPVIQFLSNAVEHTKSQSNIKHQAYKQLGLFLLYETIRNWLRIYKLYVKQINITKEFIIIDPKESYIIVTDLTINLALIQEASDILPNCNISLIDFFKNKNNLLTDLNFSYIPKHINKSTKIIIIKKNIDTECLLKLMNYLVNIRQLSTAQIRLICIICEDTKLIQISQKYPKLKIYTTKITHNLKTHEGNYLKKF